MTTIQLTEKKNLDDLLKQYKEKEEEAKLLNEQIHDKMHKIGLI